MIQPTTKRLRFSECKNEDRLSDLPESIILHILSFLWAKTAVQTCVLSVRWKDLWKRLPALKFHFLDFLDYKKFTKFVSKVLSLRDSSTALQSLDFNPNARSQPHIIKRVVNYAISHNVQRLGLKVHCDFELISHSIFSCQTLTHLKLSVYPIRGSGNEIFFPKSLNLPTLTSLYLENFTFCADNSGCAEPFSAFNKLKSLFIYHCEVMDTLTLCISSATLVNFTVHSHFFDIYEIKLCTPSLSTFAFNGEPYQKISGSIFSHVKHVDVDAYILTMNEYPPLCLRNWLLDLTNVESLTVTASTLQVLSFNCNLLETKLPSFGNLKSLKVKKKDIAYGFRQILIDLKINKIKSRKEAAKLRKSFKAGFEPSSPIPDGIIDFLLQNSPSAKVDIVD